MHHRRPQLLALAARPRARLRAVAAGLVAIAYASGAAAADDAGAQPRETRFRVTDVAGSVLAWQPWGTDWQTLRRGSLVFDGTLIQSLTPATLSLLRLKPKGYAPSPDDSLSFEMAQPAMLRLHGQLARKVAIKTISMVDGRGGLPSVRSAPTRQSADKPLVSAWRRVKSVGALMETMAADMVSSFTAKEPPPGIKQNTPAMTLEVRHPTDGSIVIVDAFPTEIAVGWEPTGPTKGQSGWYNVYIWPTKGLRGQPAARTNSLVVPLVVPAPGAYFIEVETSDQAVQSTQILIQVEGP